MEQTETKVTTFELDVLANVFNARTNSGHGIKDLRLIDKVVRKIRGAQPKERPTAPTQIAESATQEEKDAFQIAMTTYREEVDTFMNAEHGVGFDTFDKMIIKQKLSTFSQFYDHEGVRQSVLSLADKFGV